MKELPFDLEVLRREGGGYGLTLRQLKRNGSKPEPIPVVRAWGMPLRAVTDSVLQALKDSGYRQDDLKSSRKTPFHLREQVGVRLGLLLLAVKPLRRHVRVEQVAEGVRRMPDEEAYYWYSKCTTKTNARRAQHALRVLLAPE